MSKTILKTMNSKNTNFKLSYYFHVSKVIEKYIKIGKINSNRNKFKICEKKRKVRKRRNKTHIKKL